MDTLIIQTGSRHGRVAELTRSHDGSLTVGRSFRNNLVLTDIHIAPQQLKFTQDNEQWQLTVLDDINPVLLNGTPVVENSVAIKSGDRLTVGRTKLLVFSENHHIEPTRKLVLSNWLSGESINPVIPAAILLAACLFNVAAEYFESSTNLKWEATASEGLLSGVMIAIWAGIWAIAGRIIRHQHHLGLQVIVTATITVIAGVVLILADYIVYPFHNPSVNEVLGWVLFFGILTLLLRFNLLVASNTHRPGIVASVLTGLIFSVSYGFYLFSQTPDFQYFPTYSSEIKPPVIGVYRGISLENYYSEMSVMIEHLDEQRDAKP